MPIQIPEWLFPALNLLTVLVLIPVGKVLIEVRDGMRTVRQELSGADGKNGVKGDVKDLREQVGEVLGRVESLGHQLVEQNGRYALHEHRLSVVEKRVGRWVGPE